MHLSAAGLSHVGRVRARNEDALVLRNLTGGSGNSPATPDSDGLVCVEGESLLVAVIDGMGGEAGGDVAAGLACGVLESARVSAGMAAETFLRQAATDAHGAIRDRAQRSNLLRGMGAVATIGLLADNNLSILQIGDSRCYLWRNARLEQLTKDQTLVAHLVELGRLRPEQARQHPQRSQVDQALGAVRKLRPGYREMTLAHLDRLLFCTDGLTEMLADRTIAQIMARNDPPGATAAALLAKCLDAGGVDNATIAIVEVTMLDTLPKIG